MHSRHLADAVKISLFKNTSHTTRTLVGLTMGDQSRTQTDGLEALR